MNKTPYPAALDDNELAEHAKELPDIGTPSSEDAENPDNPEVKED